jgi:hypothetical protein
MLFSTFDGFILMQFRGKWKRICTGKMVRSQWQKGKAGVHRNNRSTRSLGSELTGFKTTEYGDSDICQIMFTAALFTIVDR